MLLLNQMDQILNRQHSQELEHNLNVEEVLCDAKLGSNESADHARIGEQTEGKIEREAGETREIASVEDGESVVVNQEPDQLDETEAEDEDEIASN